MRTDTGQTSQVQSMFKDLISRIEIDWKEGGRGHLMK